MMNAETLELLANKQYGSQWHKAAVLQCLNKVYPMTSWDSGIIQLHCACSNDAKHCYNCITLLAMALSLCWWGALIPTVQSMMKWSMECIPISKLFMGTCTKPPTSHHTWDTLIAGIGQGNSTGPPIWAAVSSPMFGIMCQDGFYLLLMGAISWKQCQILGFAFVDDTDLCDIFCRCGQSGSLAHAMGSDPLGRTLLGNGRGVSPREMLLVFGWFQMQQQ